MGLVRKVINRYRPPEDTRLEAGLFIRLRPSVSEKMRNAAVSFDTEVGDLVNGVLMRFLEEHGFYDDEEE